MDDCDEVTLIGPLGRDFTSDVLLDVGALNRKLDAGGTADWSKAGCCC